MRIIAFIFVLGLFFQSCSDLKKGDQLSEIQALQRSIDSIEVVLIENHIDTLDDLSMTMRILNIDLARLKSSDTVPLELAYKMDEYKWMRKSVPIIATNQVALKEGVVEVRQSLKKLEVDVSNASGRKDKYDDYIAFEQKKVKELTSTLSETMNLRDKLVNDFATIHGEINRFVKERR